MPYVPTKPRPEWQRTERGARIEIEILYAEVEETEPGTVTWGIGILGAPIGKRGGTVTWGIGILGAQIGKRGGALTIESAIEMVDHELTQLGAGLRRQAQ